MRKKILIGAGVLVLVLVAAVLYLNNRNRTLSPPGESTLENDGMSVSVSYSRPSVRDRLIFGEEQEEALQPYGVYWRLGANEPTTIDVSEDFVFGTKGFSAGEYVLYAIPRKGEMELRLSSDLRVWGYSEPDYSKDLESVVVSMERNAKTEQFTINTEQVDGGVLLVFMWDVYKWTTPVTKQ